MDKRSMAENGRNSRASCCKVRKRGLSSSSSSTAVSARKLGASLWQINEVPAPDHQVMKKEEDKYAVEHWKQRNLNPISDPIQFSDPQRFELSKSRTQKKNKILSDHSFENDCFTKTKNRLKDVNLSLGISRQLVEHLSRSQPIEEQQSTYLSLFMELDRARVQVTKLIREEKQRREETELALGQLEREKVLEQRRIRRAVSSVSEELEAEKKLRKLTERLNKKLGGELSDIKACFLKVVKELKREKKAKEILETICDDFARDIGEDRAKEHECKMTEENVVLSSELFHCIDLNSNGRKLSEGNLKTWVKDCRDESERLKKIRTLKEHMISGASSGTSSSSQDFSSPSREFGLI